MKRVFDVLLVLAVLPLVAPVLTAVALAVAGQLGRPVIFTQARPGRHGRVFRLYKFRTMTDARGDRGELLPDAERLPPFGRWLRATSLDELPELWNILRGDMSFVGPRPLLVEYLNHYTPDQARRHEVRPGLTGWAQVNGRNALSWEERFALDIWYVDHRTFWLDLKIFVLTLSAIWSRKGVAAPGQATMSRFTGSRTAAVAPPPSSAQVN